MIDSGDGQKTTKFVSSRQKQGKERTPDRRRIGNTRSRGQPMTLTCQKIHSPAIHPPPAVLRRDGTGTSVTGARVFILAIVERVTTVEAFRPVGAHLKSGEEN